MWMLFTIALCAKGSCNMRPIPSCKFTWKLMEGVTYDYSNSNLLWRGVLRLLQASIISSHRAWLAVSMSASFRTWMNCLSWKAFSFLEFFRRRGAVAAVGLLSHFGPAEWALWALREFAGSKLTMHPGG